MNALAIARDEESFAKELRAKAWTALRRCLRDLERSPTKETRKRAADAAKSYAAAELTCHVRFVAVLDAMDANAFPDQADAVERAKAKLRERWAARIEHKAA